MFTELELLGKVMEYGAGSVFILLYMWSRIDKRISLIEQTLETIKNGKRNLWAA